MLPEMLVYAVSVMVCLFGPTQVSTGLYECVVFAYAGIPLALGSVAHAVELRAANAARTQRWRAAFWLVGCAVLCVPGLTVTDSAVVRNLSGFSLSVSGCGLWLVARDRLLNGTTGLAFRLPGGAALLIFGGLFLKGGVRVLLGAAAGPMAGGLPEAEWFRLLSVFAGLCVLAAALVDRLNAGARSQQVGENQEVQPR